MIAREADIQRHAVQERRRYRTKARQKQKSAAQATWQALHRNASRPTAAADIHQASPQPEPKPPHSLQSGAATASGQSHAGAAASSLDPYHQQPLSAEMETSGQGGPASEAAGQESLAVHEEGDGEEVEEVEAPLSSMKPLSFRQRLLACLCFLGPSEGGCGEHVSGSDLIGVCCILLGGCMRRTSRIW